jgi:hypothetical protein
MVETPDSCSHLHYHSHCLPSSVFELLQAVSCIPSNYDRFVHIGNKYVLQPPFHCRLRYGDNLGRDALAGDIHNSLYRLHEWICVLGGGLRNVDCWRLVGIDMLSLEELEASWGLCPCHMLAFVVQSLSLGPWYQGRTKFRWKSLGGPTRNFFSRNVTPESWRVRCVGN